MRSALQGRAEITTVKTSAGDCFANALMLLSGPERPDAVFCVNDVLAIGVLEAAASVGLRVPDDLSVIGVRRHTDGLVALLQPHDSAAPGGRRRRCVVIVERLLRRIDIPGLPVEMHRVPDSLDCPGFDA